MAEPKPFASLSSTLLARKGQAKPAMRPQGFAGFGPMSGNPDDLGWNDMGFEPAPPVRMAPVAAVPQVVLQQAELAGELAARQQEQAEAEAAAPAELTSALPTARPKKKMALTVDAKSVVRIKGAAARGGTKAKAAFTLRLDPERHLRLRLACAVGNRSAQQLVTEAVDRLLETMPELDDLAEHVPARRVG